MGGKQPKIVSISSCSESGRFFVIGLGKDNKAYLWNPVDCYWMLHHVEPAAAAPPVVLNRQQRRQQLRQLEQVESQLEQAQEESHVAE